MSQFNARNTIGPFYIKSLFRGDTFPLTRHDRFCDQLLVSASCTTSRRLIIRVLFRKYCVNVVSVPANTQRPDCWFVRTCEAYSTLLAAPLCPLAAEKLSFSFVAPGATEARGVPMLDPPTVDASPSPSVLKLGCSSSCAAIISVHFFYNTC